MRIGQISMTGPATRKDISKKIRFSKVGLISMKNSHLNPSSKSIKVRWVTLGKMPNGFGHGVEFLIEQDDGSHAKILG